jgi:hypothetical protein
VKILSDERFEEYIAMKKTPEINNANSMGMMLTLAIALANGSKSATRCNAKRVLRNPAVGEREKI